MLPSQQGDPCAYADGAKEIKFTKSDLKTGGFPGPLGGPRVVLRVLNRRS